MLTLRSRNKGVTEIQALKLQVQQLIKAKEAAEKAAAHNVASATSEQPSDVTAVTNIPAADGSTSAPAADGAAMARSAPDLMARSLPVQDPLSNIQNAGSAVTAARSFMVRTASVPEPQSRTNSAAAPLAAASNVRQRSNIPPQNQSTSPAAVSQSLDLQTLGLPSDLESNSDSEDKLLRHLGRCADAVTKLSDEIERATQRWRYRRRYQRHGLTPAFETAHSAMKKLRKLEVDLEVSDGDGNASSCLEEKQYTMPSSRQSRRSRRNQGESERDRSAHKRPRGIHLAEANVAGLASVRHIGEMKSRMRRRSRGRGTRSSSHSDSTYDWASPKPYKDQSPRRRGGRTATAALTSIGVDALVERHRPRSRSRDRSRSRSRIRTGLPIATAGLGGAALAGLYEKHKASKETTPLDSMDEVSGLSYFARPDRRSSNLDQPLGASDAAQKAQIINNSQSERRENRVKIVDPPTSEDEDKKIKGVLRKSTQKFPDNSDVMSEGVALSQDVRAPYPTYILYWHD